MSGDPSSTPESSPPAPAASAPRPRRPAVRRWARRAAYAVGALLLLWGLGWLALPPLLKWQGQKIASERLGRTVRIGQVDFKPWTLELTLSDIAVGGAAGAPDQLTIRRVYVDGELQSIFRLAPVLDAIQVEAPALRLAHLGDGHYDVDDILARLAAQSQPPAPAGAEPARFALYNIELKDGRVDFDDRVVGRKHELRDLRLALPFISTLPSQRQVKVLPQLAFVANGSAFDSRAEALPFDATRQTDAVLRLSGLDLAPYLGYLPAGLPIQLKAGVVDADLRLDFEQAGGTPSLRLGGTLALHGLKSVDGQGADALAWDALKIALGDVRPLQRQVHLASVELTGPQLTVRRDREGRINLLPAPAPADASKSGAAGEGRTATGGASEPESAVATASASASASASAAPGPAAAPPWQVMVDKLALHGGTVDFSDDSTAQGEVPAARVRLNEVELSAETLAYPLAKPLRFAGSAALVGTEGLTPAIPDAAAPARRAARGRAPRPQAGASAPAATATATTRDAVPSIEFQGSAGTQAAELNARLAGLPLALAAPYLAPHLVPQLTGALDAHLGLQWAPPQAQGLPPELKIAAERLALTNLMLAAAPAAANAPRRGERAADALASVAQIELADLRLDWRTRAVSVGRLGVQAPRMVVERAADGHFTAQDWLRPADTPPKAPEKPKLRGGPQTDVPWKVVVNELALAGGTVGWRDAAAPQPVEAELTQLQIDARQLDLNARQPMPLNLSARLAGGSGRDRTEPGRLAWRGSVGLAPVGAQGRLDAERLPVHAFEPYFGELLNIDILRADTSFKGQLQFTQTAQGPRVRVSGDAGVLDLRTHSRPGTAADSRAQADAPPAGSAASTTRRSLGGTTTTTAAAPARPPPASVPTGPAPAGASSRAPLAPDAGAARKPGGLGEELLSWKQLQLRGLDVQLEPGKPAQVDVKETALSDFYARLIIHPDGRINLQDVVKSSGGDAAPPAAAPAPAARAAPSTMPAAGESSAGDAPDSGAENPVSTATGTPKAVQIDPHAPVIRVGPVRLDKGHVAFSDRFIRPNYSADLTELTGTLSAFSSIAPAGAPQMADLQLTGRAEGTAALEVTGKLNPLAKPLALDIHGKVTDLELPPLSPYSVKYAGHGIERGKLSMDVTYRIEPDGRLTAANKLVLNQLEFGEPVAGAPASLPVKLATALLADSHGVIDLDLPISGSLNDPKFSIGPIIFKAIVNLIGRAITAPFTLLARALGGSAGQDMSNVAFAPGSAQLQPKAREQLDKIAQALADRPQLKLTVVGTARLDAEREGYQRERLRAMVAAEKRAGAPAAATVAAAAPALAASGPAAENIADGAASTATGGQNGTETAASVVSEAEYPQLLRRLYRRADLPGKPRNAIGLQRDIGVPEMEALLMAHIEVTEDAMRALAVQRGVAVKDYLAGRKLPPERLFLGAARTGATAAAGQDAASAPAEASASAWSPRAELALTAR